MDLDRNSYVQVRKTTLQLITTEHLRKLTTGEDKFAYKAKYANVLTSTSSLSLNGDDAFMMDDKCRARSQNLLTIDQAERAKLGLRSLEKLVLPPVCPCPV